MKRARLLGTAENKLEALAELLRARKPGNKTLFYCGDGYPESDGTGPSKKSIYEVSSILSKFGWKTARFTAEEPIRIRREILADFENNFINALVAIRVLDEGIDIPGCETAYILASSRNPRQFIQRRGRILRRAPGKALANIYDFVVTPPRKSPISLQNLVKKELQRCLEFLRLCSNENESTAVAAAIARRFDLDFSEIETSFEQLQTRVQSSDAEEGGRE